jgi:hypothetical protein
MEARMHRLNALLVSCAALGLFAGCVWNADRPVGTGGGGNGVGNSTGRGGYSGTGVVADGSIQPTDDANCGVTDNPASKQPADLLIVFDRSGSMANDINDMNTCGGMANCSKWDQMRPPIIMSVMATQADIRWGLKYFADPGNNGCNVNANAQVGIAINNAGPITTSLNGANTGSRTPTRSAILNAATYLHGLTDTNPKYILLATDGLPNCIPGNNDTAASDATGAVQAIADTLTGGIPTFVVGIGNTGAAATLTMMANAGGKPTAAAPGYYQVNNTTDLVNALSTISTSVVSCVFSFGKVPPNPANIRVEADHVPIPNDATNGWQYEPGMMSLKLYGTSCQNVLNGVTQNVVVLFGCGSNPIP